MYFLKMLLKKLHNNWTSVACAYKIARFLKLDHNKAAVKFKNNVLTEKAQTYPLLLTLCYEYLV